ncbi:MAG: transposase [Candidatus Poribacteria bacterium]|nr:transposase [Candidatus Poribacteria bacterium]
MKRSQKIALDPTDNQREWFSQQCGYARVAFNFGLSAWNAGVPSSQLRKTFNSRKYDNFEWCSAMDQRAAAYSLMNLESAIDRYFRGISGRPRYKKHNARQSYSMEGDKVTITDTAIRFPKIGWVTMHERLRFTGKIGRVTISRTAHRWFVSVTVDTEETPEVADPTSPVIGIDVGINTLATLSDGTKFDNPRPLKRYERKLAREQRKLSRKEYQSNNWYKQKLKVDRIHYRIACIRNNAHHQATTRIVSASSKIGIETLKVTNMLKNRKIAKALSDSAIGGFLAMLKMKADRRGVEIVKASQFFASSKTCSNCGEKKEDLTLAERTYHCDICGYTQDRDLNAAINLKAVAVGGTDT